MNWDLLLALIFFLIILAIFFLKRDKFTVQGKIFIMYRTKWGLKSMDWLARKFPRSLNILGYISIVIGFIGMAGILVLMVWETIKLFINPGAAPGIAPVLPGVAIPGLPHLSFWHWIITIFVLAVVHEFAHGVFARLNKIEVKSSGFAFLGPIPAAFVEPDETVLPKASKKAQLEVFSAGAFSNFIFAGLFFLIMTFVLAPLTASVSMAGLPIVEILPNTPMANAGIIVGERLLEVNGVAITDSGVFVSSVKEVKPGDTVHIVTDKGEYNVVAAAREDDASKGYLGFSVSNASFVAADHPVLAWFNLLVFWMFVLNMGVGMFNLLPLGPVDGGRMFFTGMLAVFKSEDKAKKIHLAMTVFVLLLLIINLLPWFAKLFSFLTGM